MRLCEQDILVSEASLTKAAAIELVARQLELAGNTTGEYLQGMLAREKQISTWLGNGIAIPHGTPETRDAVLQTGVKVVAFLNGVEWDKGETATLVVGIASRSSEHLTILRQLTRVLCDDTVPAALRQARTSADFLAILTGQARNKPEDALPASGDQMLEATFTVQDPEGLHARPAAMLVRIIKQFSSNISVENRQIAGSCVDASKLMNVISLGAKKGHQLRFYAQGEDAHQALEAIGATLDQGLIETFTAAPLIPADKQALTRK